MADDWAIKVEGLGKRYSIAADRGRYTALRDVLSQGARRAGRRLFGRGGGSPGREPFWALRDVSFEVPRGECVGVIGRNGAGKSTLLKVLSRITEPTEGEVQLRGRVGSLLEVGTGFHPELTGRENVFLNGAILGMTRKEVRRKFGEISAFAEVEKFLDTPVKYYSSGMYARLAFAVAAHLEPEILVVDEVLAVGDAKFQEKCIGKMGDVAKGGRTVLFVSHNLPSIRALCTSAILLRDGNMAMSGPAASVVECYARSGSQQDASVQWIDPELAPGTRAVKLGAVFVTNSRDQACKSVDLEEHLAINLDYRVVHSVNEIRIGILIRDPNGTEIFGATNHSCGDTKSYAPGQYRTKCEVPGHLLNSGDYSVTVGADLVPGFDRLWYIDDCVSFSVSDAGGFGAGYVRPPGVIRPRLSWIEAKI